MSSVDAWVLASLRRAAAGGMFTVVDALRRITWRLQAHAACYGDKGAFIAVWTNAIQKQVKCIEAEPDSKQRHSRKMGAVDDPTVQDALKFMVENYRDVDAQTLLDYNGDAELRYDGDAAQRLLKELALRAGAKYEAELRAGAGNRAVLRAGLEDARALYWLAHQPAARHAYAPKDEEKPLRGRNENLSIKPRTPDEKLAEQYSDYLAERYHLLEQETGVVNEGTFEYSEEEQDQADKLWRRAKRKAGMTAGAVRKYLSVTRAAWNKLNPSA